MSLKEGMAESYPNRRQPDPDTHPLSGHLETLVPVAHPEIQPPQVVPRHRALCMATQWAKFLGITAFFLGEGAFRDVSLLWKLVRCV